MTNPLHDALLAPLGASDTPFLIRPDGSAIDGTAFYGMACRAAGALAERGLAPGDRLAVQVEKSPEALALYAGCLIAGVVFVPLNTAYTTDEIAYFLADATPGLAICDPRMADRIAALGTTPVMTLDAAGQGSFADLAAGLPNRIAPARRTAQDIAALLYTSGTTGRSKGAMLSHENLLSNARALCDLWRIDSDDVLLHALPIFHAHGLFVAVNTTLLAGARMIFLPGFTVDAVLQAMPRATLMMGVPTFYTRLLDAPGFGADVCAGMRLFVSGSAPLLAETHQKFQQRTGHRILERYGMTETGMNTSNPHDGERRAGTVGFALPGVEIAITDAGGAPVPAGEIGMIEVRGPNVFRGYWNMPDKTAEELRQNGFFITGDLGRQDADGYLHIVGRSKDLIISGGYNVYPKEVESVLNEASFVREAAVFGVPHPDFGEAVVATLVVEPGVPVDLPALRHDMSGRLARYKQPKEILLTQSLPRNTMGKVQKNLLRDRHRDLFAAPVSGTP
ncbi:MAG: malonyl-CoA synthase [Rhodobacteraceae bacterium]|nr:malonyl-CoA synthase [Paracoccaceae bacterium]